MISIRDAVAADLGAIRAIYNEVIETSRAIWIEQPFSEADRLAWFEAKQAAGEPVLVAVAEDDGTTGDASVAGFATYGRFRGPSGYDETVEHTVHVAEGARGEGVGSELIQALIERARDNGKLVMVAGIGAGNAASIAFHERHGFTEVGRMPKVGRKWGERLDLVLMQRRL